MATIFRKIFFFCFLYPPLARSRSRQLITKSLAKAGYSVKVISIKNPHGFFNKFIKDKSLPPDSGNIEVEHIKAPNWWMLGELLYIFKLIPDSQMNWFWIVKQKMKSIIDTKQGIVFGLYPPLVNLFAASYAKKITGFPLILDYRDEFLDLIAPSEGYRRKKLLKFEKMILDSADLISVASDEIKSNLQKRYGLDDKKFIVCYSGFPELRVSSDQLYVNQKRNVFPKKVLNIVYSGAISQHQKPEIIILAFRKLLLKYPALKGSITITFYAPNNYYFKHVFKKYLCDGIIYGGFLPQSKVDDTISSFDIGFLSLAGEKYQYAIPRKLFDYINIEIPVIAAVPKGETWRIIEKNNIGRIVHFSNIEGLADILYDLYSNQVELDQFKTNIRLIKNQFSAEYQYDRFANKISEIMNEK